MTHLITSMIHRNLGNSMTLVSYCRKYKKQNRYVMPGTIFKNLKTFVDGLK